MKTLFFSILMTTAMASTTIGQTPSLVNYDDYMKLVEEVNAHRKARMVTVDQFTAISKESDVIILDTRSKEMYDRKHIKGAVHLNFSDFTSENLAKIIPSPNTKILIYCNNNFVKDLSTMIEDPAFVSKAVVPAFMPKAKITSKNVLTLALNIPTYINLYGYGYKNVYELSELISVFDTRIAFEGTDVK